MERQDRETKVLSDGREAIRDHAGNIFIIVRPEGHLHQLRGADLASADAEFDGWSDNPAAHAAFKRQFG